MPLTGNTTVDIILYSIAGIVLLIIGYKVGRWISNVANTKLLASKEQELFTAQRSFKSLYDQELNNLRDENAKLADELRMLREKVEDYRKKAAGFGGLFSSSSKRADAMYALLLENEALEEALYAQNEKLKQERTDSLREQMRATGYRRVLMSQLLNDNRIKEYVAEILNDEKMLPRPETHTTPALPAVSTPADNSNNH
jgi:predicted RNase H-like nuclease (RuvC/YqgF family)